MSSSTNAPAGKTIVITGGSDGIGAAGARRLHAAGHTVVLVGRSPEKTAAVAAELGVTSHVADFTELDQVRELAGALTAQHPHIDVLINNAGGIFGSRQRTVDGFEKTLQVNHLAPFLLTNLLMSTLLASKATVINTSSVGARLFGQVDIDDLNNERNYSANKAYGDAKLENILFAKELHRRHHDEGLAAVSFHPGLVATSFAADTTSLMRLVYRSPLKRFLGFTSADTGADTMVWLAEGAPGIDWRPGEYYEKRRVAKTHKQADDAELARRLWTISAEMVGLPARSA